MPVKSLDPDDVERFMHDVAAGQDGSQGEDRATRSLDRTRRSWCRRSHKALSISDQEDIWKPAIAATWLMILTGWRRGEVLGLRWSEIDLPPRTARLAVSAKCIAIANSGFSGGAVRSTTGCFGDGGGEEDRTKVELLGHQSHWFAFFGKPGRCTRTTQKRCPVGACITTQRSRRSTTCAPSFSRRATSAGISSVSISKCTRLS